tara:strand:+ start:326 stop:514 length:189 start_codon:yes stop_codon:yes gene_type:complete
MDKQQPTKKNLQNNNNTNNNMTQNIYDLIDKKGIPFEFIYVYLKGTNTEGKPKKNPVGVGKK